MTDRPTLDPADPRLIAETMRTYAQAVAEQSTPREAEQYAQAWADEEASLSYFIECPDYGDRPALVLIVEAARSLCGTDRADAARLLRLALAELEPSPSEVAP